MSHVEEPAALSIETIRKRFFSALLSDVLDGLGYMNQAMPSTIRPLDEAMVLTGRARTALFLEVFERPGPGENPYELEIELVDGLAPDEVPVFCCGKSGRIAPWGGLLSTAARNRGAAGAVMDGMVRDVQEIRRMGFPVFHGGIGPLDSKGRGQIAAIDIPIECAGVRVQSGDLVFGDADGLVVIPQQIEREVILAALKKLEGESKTMEALASGESLGAVFAKYGVL
jgi:regulator of RNase E activity RraA